VSTPSIPGPNSPPKWLQQQAREERARRKACHGSWQDCATAHPSTAKA
jgi:hypothetical protein